MFIIQTQGDFNGTFYVKFEKKVQAISILEINKLDQRIVYFTKYVLYNFIQFPFFMDEQNEYKPSVPKIFLYENNIIQIKSQFH